VRREGEEAVTPTSYTSAEEQQTAWGRGDRPGKATHCSGGTELDDGTVVTHAQPAPALGTKPQIPALACRRASQMRGLKGSRQHEQKVPPFPELLNYVPKDLATGLLTLPVQRRCLQAC